MGPFSALWQRPPLRAMQARVHTLAGRLEEEAVAIQQIPAPTFSEGARSAYIENRFRALPLSDVARDAIGNVFARLPGRTAGPAVVVSAHLDTVFGPETDLTTRRVGTRLYGPGIADNSLGVAGLLVLAEQLHTLGVKRDIWFVANVREEGLGNLQGMRAAMERLGPQVGTVIVLEGGAYGNVIYRGIGVQRRRLRVETRGGHAWSDFGAPSAIHELCAIGAAIRAVPVPDSPRTSFNLGTIEGGTGVNTIAARANALLDMRSEEPEALTHLAEQIDAILAAARRGNVAVYSDSIGERPAGGIPPTHPLVELACESLAWGGHHDVALRAASTDANIPLALGIPAICIGLAVGNNAHRLDEYIDLSLLPDGLQHCLLVIWTAAELGLGK